MTNHITFDSCAARRSIERTFAANARHAARGNTSHTRALYCADRMLVVAILLGCLVALILF
jgi:hypothetical protein